MTWLAERRPLVAHVLYRFDTGGLENGVVNLINRMPCEAFRHLVIALTDVTEFRRRIVPGDVAFLALQKGPGHALRLYPRLFQIFNEWRPAIVHTRNLAALEAAVPAWAAGVPVRLHSEHGRDVDDLAGESRKYHFIRRCYRPFVSHHLAVSQDLVDYLCRRIGIAPGKVSQIYNGVDSRRFHPAVGRPPIAGCPFGEAGHWLVGTVGRLQVIKNQTGLARAFVRALELAPQHRLRLRLVIVGDGPLRAEILHILQDAGLAGLAWLPGERHDVPEILRGLDCFVLPSLSEGLSNVILEAMASGLPVIATAVGGNVELVRPGRTGFLVPPGDHELLARRLLQLADDPEFARCLGRAGRSEVERRFCLDAMVQAYCELYERLLRRAGEATVDAPTVGGASPATAAPGSRPPAAAAPPSKTIIPPGVTGHVRNHRHF